MSQMLLATLPSVDQVHGIIQKAIEKRETKNKAKTMTIVNKGQVAPLLEVLKMLLVSERLSFSIWTNHSSYAEKQTDKVENFLNALAFRLMLDTWIHFKNMYDKGEEDDKKGLKELVDYTFNSVCADVPSKLGQSSEVELLSSVVHLQQSLIHRHGLKHLAQLISFGTQHIYSDTPTITKASLCVAPLMTNTCKDVLGVLQNWFVATFQEAPFIFFVSGPNISVVKTVSMPLVTTGSLLQLTYKRIAHTGTITAFELVTKKAIT